MILRVVCCDSWLFIVGAFWISVVLLVALHGLGAWRRLWMIRVSHEMEHGVMRMYGTAAIRFDIGYVGDAGFGTFERRRDCLGAYS